MAHRDGEDPAALATELEILAVRGLGEIGPQSRTWMVRDRFISEQTELWTEAPFGQCIPGYANPGDSEPLPGVGKSR